MANGWLKLSAVRKKWKPSQIIGPGIKNQCFTFLHASVTAAHICRISKGPL